MTKSTISNKKFEKQIKKYLKKTRATGTKEIRRLSLFALGQLIKKSPVDEGVFRGNWNVGLNKTNISVDGDRRFREAIAEGNSVIGSIKSGDSIDLSNALPYAMRIEYGWSDQAPAGVVRVTQYELLGWLKKQNDKV